MRVVSRIACHRGDTSRARFVSSSRAMNLLMLQGACLCSDREPSSPEASAGLSLPCHGRETPVSTECASSRRAARRAERTPFSENFHSGFPLFLLDASRPGVVLGDAVDVAPELGVARLQPGAVQAVAFLDGSLDLLVVAEALVSAACVFVNARVSDRRESITVDGIRGVSWGTERRGDGGHAPPVVNFSLSSSWISPLFLPHARTARGAPVGILGKRSARRVSG